MLKRFLLASLMPLLMCGVLTFGVSSAAVAADELSARDAVIFTVEKAMAEKYYDYKKRRIIRVYVNDFTSTLQDNGLLKAYFHKGVVDSLEAANQFVLGDFDQTGVDCLLSMSFTELGGQFIKVDAEIMDAQSGQVVANVSKTLPPSAFDEEAFAAFKVDYARQMQAANKIGSTRLVVFVDSSGKSADEYEVRTSTYSSTSSTAGQYDNTYDDSQNYSAVGSSDYNRQSAYQGTHEFKEKIGRTSLYPTDIMIYVNNRSYKPNSEGIAFDQLTEPGTYKVNVKFRKAIWDGVRKTEVKGRSFSRTFNVDLAKNESARLNVGIQLQGDEADVTVSKHKMN